jgi:hypothetical protein
MHLVRFLGFGLFIVIGSALCRAQTTSDAAYFVQIFEKETNTQKDSAAQHPVIISIGAETLPEWFGQIPESKDSDFYAIGISDPKIESRQAVTQAIERAIMQFSLMTGSFMSGVSDTYSGSSGNKYEEVYKCKGNSTLLGKYSITDSFETRFGEKLLLVKFKTTPKDTLSVKTSFDIYKSVMKAPVGWYVYENISMLYKRDTVTMAYQYSKNNDNFSSASVFDREVVDIPMAMYDYEVINGGEVTASAQDTATIKLAHKGLWCGYFQAMVNSMSVLAANHRSSIKNIDELEQADNTNLMRNTMNNFIVFSIKKISSLDGNLNIELNLQQ